MEKNGWDSCVVSDAPQIPTTTAQIAAASRQDTARNFPKDRSRGVSLLS